MRGQESRGREKGRPGLPEYISKGDTDMKYSLDISNNPSNLQMQKTQTTDVHILRVIMKKVLNMLY